MLHFRGHIFDGRSTCACCVGDIKQSMRDPTGTMPLQRKFNTAFQIQWRVVKRAVRTMLVDRDLLSLKSNGLLQPVQPAMTAGGSKVLAFQRWFDQLLGTAISGGNGATARPFLQSAYSAGVEYAQQAIPRTVMATGVLNHRLDTLQTLAYVELQGICEAVSQQAVRAVANGLLHAQSAAQIARAVGERIDAIGVVRTQATVSFMTVKSFNEAVLDTYEAAKVTKVAIVPEAVPVKVTTDAKRARIRINPNTGPGSRISRTVTPSRSTVARIAKAALAVERLGKVNVRTAGDDNVCPICEDIADNGPYTINKARSLIPAHPRCRCTFVPVGDRRFAPDASAATMH
jgi:hypothetical protein